MHAGRWGVGEAAWFPPGAWSACRDVDLAVDDEPDLDRHVAKAVAKSTGRGWRLEQGGRDANVDAVIALAMAVERAQAPKPSVRVLGFI